VSLVLDDGMTPEEFLEWLEDFEPLQNNDKGGLSDSGNSQVADPRIVK
jgi:hypothetical protein